MQDSKTPVYRKELESEVTWMCREVKICSLDRQMWGCVHSLIPSLWCVNYKLLNNLLISE